MRLWQRREAGGGEQGDSEGACVAWEPDSGVTAAQASLLASPVAAELVYRVAGAGADDASAQPRVLARVTVAPASRGEELHVSARRAGALGPRRQTRSDEDGDEDGDEEEEEDEDYDELRLSYQEARRAGSLTSPAVQRAAAAHRAEIARALVGREVGGEGEGGDVQLSARTTWLTLGTVEVETPLPGGAV